MKSTLASFFLLVSFMISFPLISAGQEYQHLIIYGQSLSVGHQSYPVISTENTTGNYMIGNQIWINYGNTVFNAFNPLKGNIAASTQSQPKTRASQAIAECPLFGMANHLQLKTAGQYKFIASSAGTSGKTIEELSKESQTSTLYNYFSNTLKYAFQTSNSIHCPALVWMQGEYNYTGTGSGLTPGSTPTSDKDEYKALLLRMKDNMQSDVISAYKQSDKPLFITYQAGVQYTRGKELTIGMAHLEASNEHKDIICAGPVYPMTDRGGHLDPNGYRWFGEMLAKVYYKTVIQGEDFKPLQPKEISREQDGKTLKITFHVPVPPLVLDELTMEKIADYGFEVYDNNTRKTISGISVKGDSVFVSCSTTLSGTTEIVYAGYNANVRGHGNLRDSDTYSAYFNYLDLDKKVDNRYVYEHDASETTLRPSYEPRNASGIIYDKPYPLYNFSVAFYYRLEAAQQTYTIPNIDKAPDYTSVNYYVKTTGLITGNGLSWESSVTLDKALSLAVSKDTIHIAAGVYRPSKCITGGSESDKKDRTFEISKNITLIGGYPANATTGAISDPELYSTVLDGDISYQSTTEEKLLTGTDFISSITSSYSYNVAQGAKATEIAYTSTQGLPMKVFVFEVDLSDPDINMEVSTPGNQLAFARQKMTEQATYKDQSGHKVRGGINGDFFDLTTGEPQGILYKDGIKIKESFYSTENTYFAITKDKKALIAGQDVYNDVKSTLKDAVGGRAWLVKNGSIINNAATISDPRTCIGVSSDGLNIYILAVDGRNERYSNGMKFSELSKCMQALGAYNAINLDGGGSTTFFIRNTDTFSPNRFEIRNQPSDGTERTVANGLLIISKQ